MPSLRIYRQRSRRHASPVYRLRPEALEDRRLMDGSPYGPSPVVASAVINPDRVSIGDGDNWPVTWGDDNAIYTFYQDGAGFGTVGDSMAPAMITGDPPNIAGENILSPSGTMNGSGALGRKVSGLLMVNQSPDGTATPTLYAWVRNLHPNSDGSDATGASLIWSNDHGFTWTWEPEWCFADQIGYPVWLNAGQDYGAAPDPAHVYFYSTDGASAYQTYPNIMLGRVATDRITDPNAYEFFAGVDQYGNPQWGNFASHVPVFSNPAGSFRPSVVYDPFIQRYLLSVTNNYGSSQNYLGIFDAPNPWGPWTTVTYLDGWGGAPEQRFAPQIPSMWMSPDGLSFYLEYSALGGPYQFNIQEVSLQLVPVADAGFESPAVGAGNFQYDPTGTPWAYTGSAGVAANGSGFTSGNPDAPEGTQVGFLQGTGSFSQSVTLAAGSYQLTFQDAQRGNDNASQQDFQVLVDGSVVGTFTPASTGYTSDTTNAFTVTAGAHTIAFQGLDSAGGDNTAFVDNLQLNPATATTTTLAVAPNPRRSARPSLSPPRSPRSRAAAPPPAPSPSPSSATDTLPDGSPYHNHGVHIIRMRWGKIVEIDANEDSEAVANMLKKRAEAGVEEAMAPQIVS